MQADSNCQLAVTSSTAVVEATDNGDNINWLKWTGAAVLFVEALIVSATSVLRHDLFQIAMLSHSAQGVIGFVEGYAQ